ncbi:MAG: hypothetical protein IJE05_07205 [Clostridia bacterium]|nr:hypothetical protein [Clostridia bacterium]
MEENNVKTKKPFYKRSWFIAIVIILVIAVISGMNGNKEEKSKKLDWSEIELSEFIPEPENKYGKITTNRSNLAMIDISKITKKDYKNYVQKCIDNGYTIDLEYEPWDTVYGAFNDKGYSIRIVYLESEEEMGITLKTPEKDTMKEIEWPTNGLGAMLPAPKSNLGDISWNNSTTFIVHIGDTTISDYNEYVKNCEEKGFTNDYSKSDKSFSAYNSEGYKVHLMYLGANVVEISLKVPQEKNDTNISNTIETTTSPEEKNTENKITTENSSSNSNELSKEFKEAMDSYEEFMNEYVEFMKKYEANPTDITLLSQYATMLQKYSEQISAFEKWESEDMTTKEAAYYVDVQARVSKKLLEVSQ